MQLHRATATSAVSAIFVLSVAACGGGSGGGGGSATTSTGLTDAALASDGVIAAAHTDANLQNAWGVAAAPGGPFWIADNNSNKATLYDGTGTPQALVVTIPAGTNGPANPTGQVFNGTTDFVITTTTGSAPAQFIFAGEGGTITGWAQTVSGTTATIAYDDAAGGAVYKGLALANNGTANQLYATDLHNAKVDVFDTNFHKVALPGAFADPTIPAGFAPFGIQLLNNQLYVTYAMQDATAHDETLGAGLGYVNVFDVNGTLVKRFASAGALNAPWGIAMAPAGFGSAAGNLLIGNFGDGAINRFNPATGSSLGAVALSSGKPLLIPGLWSLVFGNGAANQPTSALFYTAGPNNQVDGVFGRIDAVTVSSAPPPCTGYGC
ncbi:MAG TPA: TIGR03118 family protein [Burkholderiaceae bacterium]|nr:TIGR03118 family protein [Burkholderiaceae bacterium]